MTPAPPPSPPDDIDLSDVLNDGASESKGLDAESVDADFEQELEDLFSDDLEEDSAAAEDSSGADDEPMVLDDLAAEGEEPVVLEDVATETEADGDMIVLEDVAEEDEDIMVLDEVVEEDVMLLAEEAEEADDEMLILDDVVEEAPAADDDVAEIEALVDDIAEENTPEPELEPVSDEDAIELDDLLDEGGGDDDDIGDLDTLLEESGEDPTEAVGEAPAETEAEDVMVLDDVAAEKPAADAPDIEDISIKSEETPEDMMDAALAEEPAPEVPVEEALADEEIDLLMDEPEIEPAIEAEIEIEPVVEEGAPVLEEDSDSDISDLAGLDKLEDDGSIDDMESLLDNVEVDVSGVENGEVDMEADDLDISDIDINTGLNEMLAAETMPQDAGVDVSDDVDVDQLLADVRTETSASAMSELQGKVAMLEGRVEELENRLREEIAQLVPAEAARIIREEIAALAGNLDD